MRLKNDQYFKHMLLKNILRLRKGKELLFWILHKITLETSKRSFGQRKMPQVKLYDVTCGNLQCPLYPILCAEYFLCTTQRNRKRCDN